MSSTTQTTSQGITGFFSPSYAEISEKVIRAEIDSRDCSGMFFFSCNPDPATKIDLQETILCSQSLTSQWRWLRDRLQFFSSLLLSRCAFMAVIPERTAEGNIHFHAVVAPHNDFDECDVRRTLWQVMEVDLTKAKHRKHSVNIKPINDSGVVDYLFHKDAHDYEVIFNRKINGKLEFLPMILSNHLDNKSYLSGLLSSEESEEDSAPPTRVYRKRGDTVAQLVKR